MTRPAEVRIVEVGPRDGLQNITKRIETAHKVAFIGKLVEAGCRRIEVASFVRKDLVPQMSDAEAVCASLLHVGGVRYSALVGNLEGLQRALEVGVKEIALFPAASETFSRKNLRMSVGEALAECGRVAACALSQGVLVRSYLSTAFWCPYEGAMDPVRAAEIVTMLLDMGAYEVSLADTIGRAGRHEVSALLGTVLSRHDPDSIALHMHDTGGNALENIMCGYDLGIRTIDCSAGGLGGCPFAKVSVGNVATEDVVDAFGKQDIPTGIDLASLVDASRYMEGVLGCELPSRYLRSL